MEARNRFIQNDSIGSASAWLDARVAAVDGDDCRLENGLLATTALSCVIKPVAGDLVQVYHAHGGTFITSVLHRPSFDDMGSERHAELRAGNAELLTLKASRLHMVAQDSIALYSGQSCEIACPQGTMTLTSRNLFTLATETLIQQARTSLSQALYFSVKALELLHLKGRQQLISAETEVRIDGEHINMG